MRKTLEIEVDGQNRLYSWAITELANLIPQLLPFVGKKIELASGAWAKGFAPTFNKPENFKGDNYYVVYENCYLSSEHGSLKLHIRMYINAMGNTFNFDRTIWLGEVNNQILTKVDGAKEIIESHGLDRVLNVADEKEKIIQYQAAAQRVDNLKSAIKVDSAFLSYNFETK